MPTFTVRSEVFLCTTSRSQVVSSPVYVQTCVDLRVLQARSSKCHLVLHHLPSKEARSSLTISFASTSNVSVFLSTAVVARGSSTMVRDLLYIKPTLRGENDAEICENAIGWIWGRGEGCDCKGIELGGGGEDFLKEKIDFRVLGAADGEVGETGDPGSVCKLTKDELLLLLHETPSLQPSVRCPGTLMTPSRSPYILTRSSSRALGCATSKISL